MVNKKDRISSRHEQSHEPTRSPQTVILDRQKSAYGGELRNTRKGRAAARPLATRQTMHLVLRSSKASFGDHFSVCEGK
jgi:hypothetical protein